MSANRSRGFYDTATNLQGTIAVLYISYVIVLYYDYVTQILSKQGVGGVFVLMQSRVVFDRVGAISLWATALLLLEGRSRMTSDAEGLV